MEANMLGCLIYTPENAPEMEVYYKVIPGQVQTFNQPEIRPGVEIYGITINGKPVSEKVYDITIDDILELESDILDHLRKQAELYKDV